MSEPVREIHVEPEAKIEAVPMQAEAPLAWHRAQVKWLIWLQALLLACTAGNVLSGGIYHNPELARALYAGLPAMRIIDYALAALLLAAAVLLVCARGRLKNFAPAGIKLLLAAYKLLAAAWIAYGAARFFAAGLSPLSIPLIGRCVGFAALGLINRSYYRKRRSLFSKQAAG